MLIDLDAFNLKAFREKRGESQRALAEHFGVHQSVICDWETKGFPTRRSSREHIMAVLARLIAPAKSSGLPDSGAAASIPSNQ